MKILYICTHNRCRSILSEAITNEYAGTHIQAKSAGSKPSGEVHPLSLKYLAEQGIATDTLRSESWNDFEDFAPDLVITVCDSAASETCPVWFGNAVKIHWGLEDPSKLSGSKEQQAQAFRETIERIKARVAKLKDIAPLCSEPEQMKHALLELGAGE